MAESDLTIRLKALDGQWETVGSERLRGIVPQNFQATANEWGSDTCSFVLRRTTGAVHPDLTAFTPCRVEVAGVKVWSGRVKETPTQNGTDEQITVQGEGMQYHLDDAVHNHFYVNTRLSDWTDWRSSTTADLTAYTAGWQVQVGSGAIVFNSPDLVGGAAVFLDTGEPDGARRVVIEWEKNTWAGTGTAFLTRNNDLDQTTWTVASMTTLQAAATSGTFAVSTSARYLWIVLNCGTAQTADKYFRVKAVRVFSDTAYESSNISTLTADDVVNAAADTATLLLSSDRSQVQAGSFVIAEYAPQGAQTPREEIAAINAYENYETKIDVDDRVCFRPRPAAPIYEIGEWSGADFSDASTNSGEDIFTHVRVQGTGPDGSQLGIDRYSVNIDPIPIRISDLAIHVGRGFGLPHVTSGFGLGFGPFKKGRAYRIRILAGSGVSGGAGTATSTLRYGDISAGDFVAFPTLTGNVYTLYEMVWVPTADRVEGWYEWTITAEAGAGTNDDLLIDVTTSTYALPDRRGFLRSKILPISSSITTAVAQRLGDLYLNAHHTTPFRGGFKVTGRGGVRRVLGGGAVHPAWLLRDTGQYVRCAHVIDPDNGAWTRSGRMATVSYDHDSQTSTVALDEDREGFEALLARLALVTG